MHDIRHTFEDDPEFFIGRSAKPVLPEAQVLAEAPRPIIVTPIIAEPIIARYWHAYRRWREQRVAAEELAACDDHILADIGITRGEIYEAVRHPRSRHV